MKEEARAPAVAGSFYPADPRILTQQVQEFLSQAKKKEVSGEIIALVAPHAGYLYSGLVAAHAYKVIQGMKWETVIVVAPSHRVYFAGGSIYDRGPYQTPLGMVPLDKELSREIKEGNELIRFASEAHAAEHSLEVQLPFLQVALGSFTLVPLVIGEQSYRTCETIGLSIAKAAKKKRVLLVASTDLSHFHSYDEAVRRDQIILEDIRAFEPKRLDRDLTRKTGEACGGGPVIAVMIAAREMGANRSEVLTYRNSGDVTGDHSEVVGYTAAVFWRNSNGEESQIYRKQAGSDLGLSSEEKKILRQIAHSAIEGSLRSNLPSPPSVGRLSGKLKEERGAFVTLKKQGQLRGCIGLIQPTKPLYRVIVEMAQAAAFDDPRFDPVTIQELQDLDLEISVLTPLQRVQDPKEIEVGKHGLYIKKGFHSGLLLPQVATEYKWNRVTFLEETCRKAGLGRNAWQDKDAEIFFFSADIF